MTALKGFQVATCAYAIATREGAGQARIAAAGVRRPAAVGWI